MTEETTIYARRLFPREITSSAVDESAQIELGQNNQTGEITSLTVTVKAEDGTAVTVTLDGQQVAELLVTIEWTAPGLFAKVSGLCPETGINRDDCDRCRAEDGAANSDDLLGEYGSDRFDFELDQESLPHSDDAIDRASGLGQYREKNQQ